MNAWWECWSSTPLSCDHMTRDGIVHLDGWSSKIFSSFGGFVRLDFYPLGLLSYGAFVHYGFSLSAHVTAWRECWSSTPVSCDHITRDLIVHLDGWSSKIFSSFGGFVSLDFYPLGLLSYGAFVHFGFLCPTLWTHDENVDRPHLYHVITWPEMGSYTLMVGVVKYFHILGVLSALIFILYGCCPMVLLSILALLCPPTWPAWWEYWSSTPVSWSHDQRFDRTPWWLEYKIFSSFGGFVRLDFYALGLLSYGAFVHYGFSLSAHVTAWRECWSSTAVSCDHMTRDGIVFLWWLE